MSREKQLSNSFIYVHLCRRSKITVASIHYTLSYCDVRSKKFFKPPRQSLRWVVFALRTNAELHKNSRNNSLYKAEELIAKI